VVVVAVAVIAVHQPSRRAYSWSLSVLLQ